MISSLSQSFKMEVPTLLVRFVSLLCSSLLITITSGISDINETDRLALLAFKATITQDQFGMLNSWNSSLHVCEWRGVTCGNQHRRVSKLDLESQRLVGTISPHIGNLTFLEVLHFSNNSFHGEIPSEVGRLLLLKELDLQHNTLEGEIPINVSRCVNLINFSVYDNKLIGRIPSELGYLSKLERLILSSNNLSGVIPFSLGNLSSLSFLSLRYNTLQGNIPSELGQLLSLNRTDLSSNSLSGIVPPSMFNLSLLTEFSMSENQLQGSLPFNIGITLPNLRYFSVVLNNFTGPIPVSFSNCYGLKILQLSHNNFVGSVPNSFGNLQSLRWLTLTGNMLGNGDQGDDDLSFLTSLTNCTNLVTLYINENNFGGMLPNSIANLSTKLSTTLFGRNRIYGSITTGIGNLVGLTRLKMEDNLLTGKIPTSIGKLRNLRELYLHGNTLTAEIPSSLGNLTQLNELVLAKNKLVGKIPSSLGNLTYLVSLDLSQNKLSGSIPEQVIGLSSLSINLNLACNSLSGALPSEVGKLKNLGVLNLSENKLSGEIPNTIGECSSLVQLLLEDNLFRGNIPPSLSSLKGLEVLSLSGNNLSGRVPKYLEKLSALRRLNLSFNHLEGDVPSGGVFKNLSGFSFVGNSKLCGGIEQLQLPNCHITKYNEQRKSLSIKVIIIIVIMIVFLISVASLCIMFCWRKTMRRKPSSISNFGNRQFFGIVSYNDLLKATDEFSSSNLLGVGSFGSVYKANLYQDEKPVAVKVLNLQQKGASKSFMVECDALRRVRHRNLLKIITSCSSTDFQGNDFKALVFELMPNGSLDNWLHPSNVEDRLPHRNLGFEERLNIAIDVASALEYLHHHCGTPVVHCDLKPSNVLLDENFVAHVGDFGLAKLLFKSSSYEQNNQNITATIKGSIGYVAPEYGMGSEVSRRGDVYSYGILMLEIFTGSRACLLLEGRNDNLRECLTAVIQIGVTCSAELPANRMDMNDVVVDLNVIKNVFLGNRDYRAH